MVSDIGEGRGADEEVTIGELWRGGCGVAVELLFLLRNPRNLDLFFLKRRVSGEVYDCV